MNEWTNVFNNLNEWRKKREQKGKTKQKLEIEQEQETFKKERN